MAYSIPPLPDLDDFLLKNSAKSFAPLVGQFFLQTLDETQHDPIIERLATARRLEELGPLESGATYSPPALANDLPTAPTPKIAPEADDPGSAWLNALQAPVESRRKNELFSWDGLVADSPLSPKSVYASEQPDRVLAAIRFKCKPTLLSLSEQPLSIALDDFHHALSSVLVGNSSSLFIWDPVPERFLLKSRDSDPSNHVSVSVDSLDSTTTNSLTTQFSLIGTLIRRLQGMVMSIRTGSAGNSAAAFAHGLESIIDHAISFLMSPPQDAAPHRLSEFWYRSQDIEALLTTIAGLCERDYETVPPYAALSLDRSTLAGRIHDLVADVFSINSRASLRPHLAYLLSSVSNGIFVDLGSSIGLTPASFEQDQRENENDRPNPRDSLLPANSLPDFIPVHTVDEITRGARSMSLLAEMKPDHPLCHPEAQWKSLGDGWCWSEEAVEERIALLEEHVARVNQRIEDWRWNSGDVANDGKHAHGKASQDEAKPSTTPALHPTATAKPAFDFAALGFDIFELEPGDMHNPPESSSTSDDPSLSQIPNHASFISDFPPDLPFSAPTLETLLNVSVLQPLVVHARILSTSLVELLLSDMDYIGHLQLLSEFILVANPSFASHVRTALFSESDDPFEGAKASLNRARDRRKSSRILDRQGMHRQPSHNQANYSGVQGWGVGLNPALSDRGEWPPAGSDLAFALRRVIVDTLDGDRVETDDGELKTGQGKQRDEIWSQAEWRLGFIIKTFDEEEEADEEPAWADPFSIHALEFLEMDYKAPATISSLLTSDILDKYRRVFAFQIRLLRVDSVSRLIFRATRPTSRNAEQDAIFAQLPSAQKRLEQFSFQANSFIHCLSSYITDSAIKANHSVFIDRLTKLRYGVQEHGALSRSTNDTATAVGGEDDTEEREREAPLSDVFSIMEYHSRVMDRILESCLLKARHQGVGGTSLIECMDTVLRVGKLVMDLRSGRLMDQSHGERKLIKLVERFQICLHNLITGLTIIDESGLAQSRRTSALLDDELTDNDLRALMRGEHARRTDATGLSNLLLRLDASGFHTQRS